MEMVKIIGVGFLGLITTVILKEYKKEYAIYASLICGSLILLYSMGTIKSILDFSISVVSNSKYNNAFIKIILKITGIAILTEYAVSICKDLGENSIANKIDFASKIIVVSLSIPIISNTLEILTELLP